MKILELQKIYLFVHTTDDKIIARMKTFENVFENSEVYSNNLKAYSRMFYKSKKVAGNNMYYYLATINDQQDYDLSSMKFNSTLSLTDDFDTLLSYCFVKGNQFVAGSDYLAILNHFFYNNNDTFICSNNAFLIAKLVNANLSEKALFETLFFRFPKGQNTFFAEIKCLRPNQQISFSDKDRVVLSSYSNYYDILYKETHDIFKDIDIYFGKVKKSISKNSYLSFSGGSDSMTILSILLHKKFDFQLASFSGHDDWDTVRIQDLAKKNGLPMKFINTNDNENEHEKLRYVFITNGFSPASHFQTFYQNLLVGSTIFDGYSFILGDYSDAFLFPPFSDVLKGKNLNVIFQNYYLGIDNTFLLRMKDYLISNYSHEFVFANSTDGLKCVQNHSVDFIPSRVLSGVLGCSDINSHYNYSFFLSRKFMTYVHFNNYGISKTFVARNDYLGDIVKLPLAKIVKKMNQKIYNSKMDHGFSFKDINESPKFIKLKMKLNILEKKKYYLFRRKHIEKPAIQKESQMELSFDFLKKEELLNFYARQSLGVIQNVKNVYDKLDI